MRKNVRKSRKKRWQRPVAEPNKENIDKYFVPACVILYLFIAFLYWPSVHYQPISLDDISLLKEFGEKSFSQVWGTDHFGHLRPVKNLLFWFMARDTEHLSWWRIGIVCSFLLSVFMVQRLSERLFDSQWWGLATAVCWSLNPTTPSVVCWLSAANISICMLGVLVYLLLSEDILTKGANSLSTQRATYSIALAGLLAALLSYQLAIFAPLWLTARLYINRSARPERSRVIPLIIGTGLCITVAIGFYVLSRAPTTDYRFANQPKWLLSLGSTRYLFENIFLWVWQVGHYGVLFVEKPADYIFASSVSWLLLLLVIFLIWIFFRRDNTIVFALLWLTIFLVPMTNLFPIGNTPVAVHYLYIPGVGLAILLCQAIHRLGSRFTERWKKPQFLVSIPLLAIVMIAWLPETRHILATWESAERVFLTTVQNYPNNIEARANLSAIYIDEERYSKASKLIDESRRLAPQDHLLIRNHFALLWKTGQTQEALELLNENTFLLKEPAYRIRKGCLLERLERHKQAIQAFRSAFRDANQSKDRFKAGYYLATTLVRTGHLVEAKQIIEELMTEYPNRQALKSVKKLLEQEIRYRSGAR